MHPEKSRLSLSHVLVSAATTLAIAIPASAQRHYDNGRTPGPAHPYTTPARSYQHPVHSPVHANAVPGPHVRKPDLLRSAAQSHPSDTAELGRAASAAADDLDDIDDVTEGAGDVADDTADCNIQDCSDEADVRIVSALFPYSDGRIVGPEVLTLVLENSGPVRSAGSLVSVAPRQHLSLVSQMNVPSLAPGERTVIQVPLEVGPQGVPCVAITIDAGISPTLDRSIRYASAAPLH